MLNEPGMADAGGECRHCGRPVQECVAVILWGHRKSGCRGFVHWHNAAHSCGDGTPAVVAELAQGGYGPWLTREAAA
jgi:hypothetical protein